MAIYHGLKISFEEESKCQLIYDNLNFKIYDKLRKTGLSCVDVLLLQSLWDPEITFEYFYSYNIKKERIKGVGDDISASRIILFDTPIL